MAAFIIRLGWMWVGFGIRWAWVAYMTIQCVCTLDGTKNQSAHSPMRRTCLCNRRYDDCMSHGKKDKIFSESFFFFCCRTQTYLALNQMQNAYLLKCNQKKGRVSVLYGCVYVRKAATACICCWRLRAIFAIYSRAAISHHLTTAGTSCTENAIPMSLLARVCGSVLSAHCLARALGFWF